MPTLEERIHSLPDVSPEDAKAACALVQQQPDLNKTFNSLVDLVLLLHDNKPKEFIQQFARLKEKLPFGNDTFGHIGTFLALIGGVKLMVKVYTDLLQQRGWDHVTEERLYSGQDGGGDEVDGRGDNSDIGQMRKSMLGLTDTSEQFACRLAESGLFQHLVDEVRSMHNCSFQLGVRAFYVSMGILYNCARSTDLRHKFRGDNTANVFTPMLAKENSIVKLMTLLTLSYIIDEDDNDLLLAEGDDFDFLLRMIGQAWKAPDHRYWESLQTELMYFRLEELLQGLTNLARNDKNKKLLVKKGALDLLKPILREGSDVEKHEATKALWQLAFDDDNKHAMKKEPGIIELLHQCKEHKHSGIASAADGILWVLGLEKKLGKDTRRKLTPSVEQALDKIGETASASSTGHVMISYQWDHQKTLKQIRDRLRERQYNVWMDIDHISGSTLQAMAEAVEGAAVVLMCMSQRYKDSPNCRMEAEYAAKLKRTIIPLLMESGYTPNGWLGILLGSKLYFDFSGRYPFDKKFEELVRELGEKGKLSQTGSSCSGQTEGKVDTRSDISSWTKEDVAIWLSDHHLNRHGRLKKLSGKNLIFLQKLSKRAPEYFYMYLDKKLHLTDLDDMMNFSDAIDALP